ncbi:MAG: ATP synthase subunit C [gamma proteobacterium symbiont of Taylorina sp.]|nr:ATP synthase subunit C [gamma proteobacterium symbiont of Taylorina sp.]
MTITLLILSFSLIGSIALGTYFEIKPFNSVRTAQRWLKGSIIVNLSTFVLALFGTLFMGIQEVMAEPAEVMGLVAAAEFSIGKGMAFIGVALPTCIATYAAGMAIGPIGAAALAAISEKPENFGRSLIYLGLAEGIAIYGLVVSILLMGKI